MISWGIDHSVSEKMQISDLSLNIWKIDYLSVENRETNNQGRVISQFKNQEMAENAFPGV